MARPEGAGRALTTYRIPIEGGDEWLEAAKAEWSNFAEMVDRMWSLAENLVPLGRAELRRSSRDGARTFDLRVRERARKLADDARIITFDRLGDNSRALGILTRRLDAFSPRGPRQIERP